ncbi:hypothetical protein CSUI_008662, partial [Cystoisospora suis]
TAFVSLAGRLLAGTDGATGMTTEARHPGLLHCPANRNSAVPSG